MDLQNIANIAQIIIVIWGLFVGTLTLPSLLKRLASFIWSLVTKPTKRSTAGLPSESPLVSAIYLIRNSFSIGPLIFTWYSLAIAASSYQKYLQEHPSAVAQPFLLLWQEGFGGNSLTFYQVAVIDAALLIIFLTLTLMSSVLSSKYERRRNQRELKEISNVEVSNKLEAITKNEATTESNQTVSNIGIAKIAEGVNIVLQETLKEISLEMDSTIKTELDEMYHRMKALTDGNKSALEKVERQLLTQREDFDRIIAQVANGTSETYKITNTLSEVEKQMLETTLKLNKLVEALPTANIISSISTDDPNGNKEPKR